MKLRWARPDGVASSAALAPAAWTSSSLAPLFFGLFLSLLRCLLLGLGLDGLLGGAQLGQAALLGGEFGWELVTPFVLAERFVFGRVGGLGLGQHGRHLGLELFDTRSHPVIAHGLVFTRRRPQLGAVEGDAAEFDQSRLGAQGQHLDEQGVDGREVPAPKAREGAVVGSGVRTQPAEGHVDVATPFHLP